MSSLAFGIHPGEGQFDAADLADAELVERWTVDGQIVDLPRLPRFGVCDDLIAWCAVVEREPEQVDRIIG